MWQPLKTLVNMNLIMCWVRILSLHQQRQSCSGTQIILLSYGWNDAKLSEHETNYSLVSTAGVEHVTVHLTLRRWKHK